MANVIKHKRGSGSDPVANDLVVGEVAIRTDVGKLFTKMDNGSVAEIAGGGSDIAINTLSSSSATGGGSATFNGSAYRFTLSQPPSVSAQQLLVSINGVIQKPVAGTGQPSEGFSVDGTDIILGDAPATGSDFFILTFKSLGVSEPADNSVTSAKIVDGAIVNADINASAAIAGTKIDPDFGSQNITTTNDLNGKSLNLTHTSPQIQFVDSNGNPDYTVKVDSGLYKIIDATNSNADRFIINTDGHIDIAGNLDVGAGVDVTGAITGTGDLTIDTNTLHVDSSNNRIGIGTTSPTHFLHLESASSPTIKLLDTTNNTNLLVYSQDADAHIGTYSNHPLVFDTNSSERMRIDSAGIVRIGDTTSGYEDNDSRVNIIKAASGGTENPLLTLWNPTTVADARAGIDLLTNAQSGTGRDGAFIRGSNDGVTAKAHIQFGTIKDETYAELVRFQSGGGISFNGDSAAANALDDYEEGSWTPAIRSGGGTITNIFAARYTKIGRLVHIQAYIQYNGSGSGSAFQISGLPYNAINQGYSAQVVDFGRGGKKGAYSRAHPGNDFLEFLYSSESTSSDRITIKGNQVGGSYIIFSNTYQTG